MPPTTATAAEYLPVGIEALVLQLFNTESYASTVSRAPPPERAPLSTYKLLLITPPEQRYRAVGMLDSVAQFKPGPYTHTGVGVATAFVLPLRHIKNAKRGKMAMEFFMKSPK